MWTINTELHQLERTLGIRMERMQADSDLPAAKPERAMNIGPIVSAPGPRMARLPGEVFQSQLEN